MTNKKKLKSQIALSDFSEYLLQIAYWKESVIVYVLSYPRTSVFVIKLNLSKLIESFKRREKSRKTNKKKYSS